MKINVQIAKSVESGSKTVTDSIINLDRANENARSSCKMSYLRNRNMVENDAIGAADDNFGWCCLDAVSSIVDMLGWCWRNFSLWIWLIGALRLQKILPDWNNGAPRRCSMAQQPGKLARSWLDRWKASIRFARDQWSSDHWNDSLECYIFRWRGVRRFGRVCQIQMWVDIFPTYSRYWNSNFQIYIEIPELLHLRIGNRYVPVLVKKKKKKTRNSCGKERAKATS